MQTSRFKQAARFCIAGAAGVIAYYAALYWLTEFFGVWYIASAIIGFILNTGLNFSLQKFWTFQNKETHRAGHQLVLYSLVTTSLLTLNALCLYCMVQYLHMWYIGAQVILTVVLTITSFFATKRIFTPRSRN